MNSKKIGKKLKTERMKLKLTQEQAAKKLKISPSSVAMYEIGERVPSDQTKCSYAKLFNTSVEELFFM